MTEDEIFALVRKIRKEGYAVIVWSPDELRGLDPYSLEDMSMEYGFKIIRQTFEESKPKSGYNPINRSGNL